MRHSLPIAPQFYVTAPQPCPYLEGRMERKLFTALQGDSAERLNDSLSKQGFRRSQNVLYRPSCSECASCLSARIRVADFVPSRGQARVVRRNAHLRRKASSPWATEEQYALFRDYLDSRHATGGMADMDLFEFAAMVEETPVRTRLIEYTDPNAKRPVRRDDVWRNDIGRNDIRRNDIGRDDNQPDRAGLRAVCLTDILDDGLSMVYSFFDPEYDRDSLGTHVILDHIAIARELVLPYVYLGYWVPGSQKMGYKAKFGPLEIYREGRWQRLDDPASYEADLHPLSSDPIAEQVARIQLPDGMGR